MPTKTKAPAKAAGSKKVDRKAPARAAKANGSAKTAKTSAASRSGKTGMTSAAPNNGKTAKAPKTRMSLAEVMKGLEAAGAEKTRQTYLRQGAQWPVFGVAFGTLKQYVNKIGIDHDLALQRWDTGNVDARHLAAKLVDPAEITPAVLDRWAKESGWQWCMTYAAAV